MMLIFSYVDGKHAASRRRRSRIQATLRRKQATAAVVVVEAEATAPAATAVAAAKFEAWRGRSTEMKQHHPLHMWGFS